MSMAMPRSDDVPAESQPMMFVLASDMAERRGICECPCFSCYLTSRNVII